MNAVSTLAALALLLLLASAPTTATAARDEVWEVEEEVLAQMARMKVRKHTDNQARSGLSQLSKEAGSSNAGCGNLNVGNVRGNRRGSDQNVTVIVTGNVINANNRCAR
jgi:hypothetical protein